MKGALVMSQKLVNIGFGNSVVSRRVIAIISPTAAPIKRLRDEARDEKRLVDATQGRKTRSVIVTDRPSNPRRLHRDSALIVP
jgi:regulator of extracellular matrix RemA (YlzA/DUF370 family)